MGVIVLFSVLVAFIVVFLVIIFATKTFISKTNFFYMIPTLLLVWAFYSVGYKAAYGYYDGTSVFETLAAAVMSTTFRINRDYISTLIAADKLYMVGIYASIALCGVTTWSTALAFVKVSIVNFFRTQRRLHTMDCDIVYGNSHDAIEYCKQNKHSVLWINPRDQQLDNDAKKAFYLDGIAYITKPFNAKTLSGFLKFRKNEIQLVCFQENEELLSDIFSTIEDLPKDKGPKIAFKVQSDSQHIKHIERELNLRQADNDLVSAECFDSDLIVARDFALRHNIARYLPEGFLRNGILQPGKNIEVTMYGFAKTGQAVFESLVEQTQFVEVKDGKFVAKPVRFRLFDIDPRCFNTGLYAYLKSYRPVDEQEFGLPPFEMTIEAEAIVKDVNIELGEAVSRETVTKDDNTFKIYIICLTRPMDNAMFADRVASFLDPKHGVVFYCVNYRSEALIQPASNAIAFGFKGEILRHECLADDELRRYAEMQHRVYGQLGKEKVANFNNLPVVEMRSNIANELNMDFKLGLLGLMREVTDKGITKEEFYKYIDPENTRDLPYDYAAYQNVTTRNLIAYQEHLRWCMYYFVNTFVPMRLSEVHLVDGKAVHKNLERKAHACLTAYRGLDVLHKYELKLYQEANIEKTIADVETYKYDIAFVDSIYDKIVEMGYDIVPINRN